MTRKRATAQGASGTTTRAPVTRPRPARSIAPQPVPDVLPVSPAAVAPDDPPPAHGPVDERFMRHHYGANGVAAEPNDPRTLSDLANDPHNRRKHNARNVAMIAAALQQVGAARSIVIDERNEVLAGNGVLEAARQSGLTKLQVIDADGDTVVAVRRTGLTDAQKRDLAIYDNRTAELAEWDLVQLEADFQNGDDLKPFFTDDELRKLIGPRTGDGDDAADQVVPGTYLVVITCADEAEQVRILDRFAAEGLSCKALVS